MMNYRWRDHYSDNIEKMAGSDLLTWNIPHPNPSLLCVSEPQGYFLPFVNPGMINVSLIGVNLRKIKGKIILQRSIGARMLHFPMK